MKNALRIFGLLLALIAGTASAQTTQPPIFWQPITQWFMNPGQVRQYANNAAYTISHIAPGVCGSTICTSGPQNPGQWNTVDLTRQPYGINSAAKVASLVCDLIITGYPIAEADGAVTVAPSGADGLSPHIHLTFRASGDSNADPTAYIGDVETPLRGDGTRSNFSVLVPLNQGKFDWLISYDPTSPLWNGTSAGGPAYGVNCSVQAWAQ